MKPRNRWILVILVAAVCGYFYCSDRAAVRDQAFERGIENSKLAEKYFLKLARDEMTKSFPDLKHDVNLSGGWGGNQGHFESLTANDLYFWVSVPVSDVQKLVDRLSLLPEIAEWKARGPLLKLQRDCKFFVSYAGRGNKPNDRPMIRMLFHESDWPAGEMNPNNLGFMENMWK